ncbi:MAG: 2-amino-4-hydroxy-6-hydroxymethyldihydropteridine diphosphokinase [Thiomargarita sp.]|nr:2-amino-4-hydroxy-6-hydroxymethyldihydropteridine diphosphokinase [Thiomargarita sp.]
MAQIYISIGSNIEPKRYINAGLIELEQNFGQLISSSVYESKAIGFAGDNFYNLVAGFTTHYDLIKIFHLLHLIENNNDRKRTANPFSPRTLDLDILLYDDIIYKEDKITVPGDEILQYAFVLQPLSEIAPDLKHPILQKTYTELWHSFEQKNQQTLKKVNL